MVEQVKGYLMRAKSYLDVVRDALNFSLDDSNYIIFIPQHARLLGYFKDKELNLSVDRFYEPVSGLKQLKDLSAKVSKGKFLKVVDMDDDVLDLIESAECGLTIAKDEVRKRYADLTDFFNYSKFQK
jgi:hypothetical protein